MRKLKHHEAKLLKKVDLIQWKKDSSLREMEVIRRYHIQRREDYLYYTKLAGSIKKLSNRLKKLDPRDPFRIKITDQILDKLYKMGVLNTQKSLSLCDNITSSAFCRRRLAVVMVRMKFAESIKRATTFIEQGHIRVGPYVVHGPRVLVSRSMEDFITWTDHSKIKRHVLKYNDTLDDYDLL